MGFGLFNNIGKLIGGMFVVLIVLFVLLLILGNIFVVIEAGYVGVIYDPLAGGVQARTMGEGFYVMMPWQTVTHYNLRTMSYNMHPGGDDIGLNVITAEGLTVKLDLSVLYHVESDQAPELYKNVGTDYAEVLIKPVARATARDLVATYNAEDLYTTNKRVILQASLTNNIKGKLEGRGIIVEDVLIRDIILPDQIQTAIETKLTAEQDAKRMEFVLQKEQSEAERKVIEAKGISESQTIIANSLTDSYLTWYWIQNLKDQKSVIYVPIQNNGLPLFKNVDQTATQ
jgi:regulator of protease activity HflC (stomatin/prohibitin superfamily)